MFIGFRRSSTSVPYSPSRSYLAISHPSIGDTLLLSDFLPSQEPYSWRGEGQKRSNNRSVVGALRLVAGNWSKRRWDCDFLASDEQLVLLEALLATQATSLVPLVLVDHWEPLVVNASVWLQAEDDYRRLVVPGWWRAKFALLEV